MGKTSVVLEALRGKRGGGHLLINCWGKTSLGGFVEAIYESFLRYQSRKGLSLEKILQSFGHLRPKASIDPDTGIPSFSIELSERERMHPRTLESVLDPIGREGKRSPIVVVFDEFQSLMQLKESEAIIATLRGVIQLQPEVTYFYLGSMRNEMDELFNNPNQPFFKSATPVHVGPIPRRAFSKYLLEKFATGGRTLEDGTLTEVYELANDVTGDVQQLCSEMWSCSSQNEELGRDTVKAALNRIHQNENESNSRIIDLLTPGQVRVLLGIATMGGKHPTSKEFLSGSRLRQASSVAKALKRLTREGILYRDQEGYHFFSPFFRTWLLANDIQA